MRFEDSGVEEEAIAARTKSLIIEGLFDLQSEPG
jgi:hypothetical protein